MKKILFITSLSGRTVNPFMKSAIIASNELGAQFYLACNYDDADLDTYTKQSKEMGFIMKHIPFHRNPLSLKNVKAKKELIKLIKSEDFDVVHCNTPIGGLLGRLVCKKLKKKNVIYTAHGFHFYKGSSLKSWLFYYPIEKYLGKYTDLLVTINKEDFITATRKNICKRIIKTHGVGINTSSFVNSSSKEQLRRSFGLPIDKNIVLNVGELIKRKNLRTYLRIAKDSKNDNCIFVLCGRGKCQNKLIRYIKHHNLTGKVKYIEYIPHSRIQDLYFASDVFCFTTFQEGLPSVLLEAMMARLPCVVSNVRGNIDLIDSNFGGFLCHPKDHKDFLKKIDLLLNDKSMSDNFGEYNSKKAKEYDIHVSVHELKTFYSDYLNDI